MSNNRIDNDKYLIEELKNGNKDAYDTLFKNYSSRLFGFAFSFYKSKEDAEELVQDVFIKIWENRSNLKLEYHFKTYLFTIAFNQIKKHFRSKSMFERYLASRNSKENEIEYFFEESDYTSLKELVDHLVDNLPPRRKEVFRKSRFDGKTIMEISEEMNISTRTVENHLNQALRFLRKHLHSESIAGVFFFFFL
jgi:RNA polymerase sigma-70 factor (ECF subfamily)